MNDRYGPRDSTPRMEALVQAALSSDYGRRRLAATYEALNVQLRAGKLTADVVLAVFKRHVDISVAHQLSRASEVQVGYHNYTCSGLALKSARRLADEFLARSDRPVR
jgi:hypothetical protein